MAGMFNGAASFNQPLDKWDVSNVKDMNCMFQNAASFNRPLDKWDVSSVKDMCWMFCNAASFNQPLGKWDVSSVKDMMCMFQNAASFDQPLGKWAVADRTRKFNMFADATSFNQPATRKHFGLVLSSPSRTHAVRPQRQSRMLTTAPTARTVAAQTRRGLQCCIVCATRQRGHPPPGTRAPAHARAVDAAHALRRAPAHARQRCRRYSQDSRSTLVPSHGHCADRRRPAWRMQA
jgi:surface protein